MLGICPRRVTDEGLETSSWVPQGARQGREGAGTQVPWTFPMLFSVKVSILPKRYLRCIIRYSMLPAK